MEASVVCSSAYLKATSRDSYAIRVLLDRQEAEYVDWRSNRKPIRHPFASSKLNSPLQCLPRERQQASSKPLWLALLEPTQQPECRDGNTARVGTPSSTTHRASVTAGPPHSRPSTRGGARGLNQSASTPLLPLIQRARDATDRLSTAASLASAHSQLPPQRKKPSVAKRRLQTHLYDFHCATVFSMAPGEIKQVAELSTIPLVVDDGRCTAHADPKMSPPLPKPEVAISELPPPEQDDPYVLSGLGVVSPSFFDDLFEFDWTHSDVDRIVRDAVERSRIQSILRRHYRVLVLYFRQYAGKTALSAVSSQCVGSDFLQIPNRLSLLDDLNVQCVDPVKYGLTETSLRREGLVTLVTHAAKMVAAHSPNAAQFRLFAAEGVDMSEAVRSLMADHLVVYAQLQDAAHFRDVFLMDHHDRQGRRLRHLLTTHEASLSSLFFDAIATTAASSSSTGATNRVRVRSDSYRVGRLVAPQATTMNFDSFVSVLKTLGVIPSKATRRQRPARDSDTSSTSPAKAVVRLDENRAMRIFQQCLDLHAELSCGTTREPQLTYPQFVEALLRVTLILHETTICHGGLDVCPGQHTSDPCRCRSRPPAYDLSAFDDAIEAVFARIQSHRLLRQATKRSNLKMASARSLLHSTRAPQRDQQPLMIEPGEIVSPPTPQ